MDSENEDAPESGITWFRSHKTKEAKAEYFARRADPNYKEPESAPEVVARDMATYRRHVSEDEAQRAERNKGMTPDEIKARDDAELKRIMRETEPDIEAIRARMRRNDEIAEARHAAERKAAQGRIADGSSEVD